MPVATPHSVGLIRNASAVEPLSGIMQHSELDPWRQLKLYPPHQAEPFWPDAAAAFNRAFPSG
jgi:hypothetical protein